MRATAQYRKLIDPRSESYLNFKHKFYGWQKHILEIINHPPNDRTVYWIYDSLGGLGKTTFCKHLLTKRGSKYFKINRKEDVLFRISSDTRLFIFDIPRAGGDYLNYELLETIKDGYWESTKYEGSTVARDEPCYLFCFSN